jgi:hypothetical protein
MSNQTGTVSVDGSGNVAWVSGDNWWQARTLTWGEPTIRIMGGITLVTLVIAYNYQIASFGVLIREAALRSTDAAPFNYAYPTVTPVLIVASAPSVSDLSPASPLLH